MCASRSCVARGVDLRLAIFLEFREDSFDRDLRFLIRVVGIGVSRAVENEGFVEVQAGVPNDVEERRHLVGAVIFVDLCGAIVRLPCALEFLSLLAVVSRIAEIELLWQADGASHNQTPVTMLRAE